MIENSKQEIDKQDTDSRIAPKSLDTGSNGQFQQYMTFFGIYHIPK